jgi:hypothetical protein
MRWAEVKSLLLELRRETRSHFYANLAEQRLAVPIEGVYGIALAVASMNQWRERGAEPLKMPSIFMSPTEAVPVTDADRERAEAMLSGW